MTLSCKGSCNAPPSAKKNVESIDVFYDEHELCTIVSDFFERCRLPEGQRLVLSWGSYMVRAKTMAHVVVVVVVVVDDDDDDDDDDALLWR